MSTETAVTIIVQTIILLLITGLTASIHIKIKFADTASQARAEAMRIFVWVGIFLSIAFSIWLIVHDLLWSSEPLSKAMVGRSLLALFAIMYCIGLVAMLTVLSLLRSLSKHTHDSVHEIYDSVQGIIEVLKAMQEPLPTAEKH